MFKGRTLMFHWFACPTVLYSEYVLKTTGCGLPAGPGGALGALEGISYLVVAGIFI